MKPEDITRLVELSKEIAQKILESYTENTNLELSSQPKAEEKLSYLESHSEKLKLELMKWPGFFASEETLKVYLSFNPRHENFDLVIKPWYKLFLLIEKDSDFIREILTTTPDLYEDLLFIHGRQLYTTGVNDTSLDPITLKEIFCWNVQLMVLAYHYLIKEKICSLEDLHAALADADRGLNCQLTQDEKSKVFRKLKDGGYIKGGTEEHFISAFTHEPLPRDFKKIKWVLTGKLNKPHKTALREFLEIFCFPGDTSSRGTIPTQKEINSVIEDENGNPIKLAKPTRRKPSGYLRDMERFLD